MKGPHAPGTGPTSSADHGHRSRSRSLRGPTIPILLVLAALGSLLWHVPQRLGAQDDLDTGGQRPNPRFGMCFVSSAEDHADGARYARALSTGTTWNRYPFYWQNIEKSAGQYDYSAHDPVVSQDVARGLRTLAILMGTSPVHATGGYDGPAPLVQQKLLPLWGAGRLHAADLKITSAASAPRDLDAPVFADGTDLPGAGKEINAGNPWARFVYQTVSRYKPGGLLATQSKWPPGAGVSHWEIWNEPDWTFFWAGTVEQYYRLLQVAYLAAKHADPDCTVLLGGLATYFDPSWFPRLLDVMSADPNPAQRAANNHYFDALAVHFYSSSHDALSHLQRARDLLAAHGLSKPLWATESGVPVWDDYPGPQEDPRSPYRATKQEQAAYVIQAHAYSYYAGAQVVFHFQLHDDCGNGPTARDAYGLFRNTADAVCYPSDAAARPSYRAYQVAAEQFRDLRPLWRQVSNGDHELIAFYRPSTGHRLVVMWTTQGHDVQAHVAALSSTATLMDMSGGVVSLRPQNGYYTVALPRATNQNLPGSSSFMIGGLPYILIEKASLFSAADLIYNGSFERDLEGWQTMGSTAPTPADSGCRSGKKCLLLGSDFRPDPGMAEGGNSTAYQELVIDPGLLRPTLRFSYRLSSEETKQGQDWFEAIVITLAPDGSATATYLIKPQTAYRTCNWTDLSFDLSSWRGKRVRMVFNLYQSSDEKPTLAWVDDVSLKDRGHTLAFPVIMRGASASGQQ